MTSQARTRPGPAKERGRAPDGLSLENRSRHVMSELVHDVVAEAFRLNLHGAPAGRVEKANGAPVKTRGQDENG